MAQRKKFGTAKSIASESEQIASIVTDEIMGKEENTQAKRFNIRIPYTINERLDAMSAKTGLTKTHIILSGIRAELIKMENEG